MLYDIAVLAGYCFYVYVCDLAILQNDTCLRGGPKNWTPPSSRRASKTLSTCTRNCKGCRSFRMLRAKEDAQRNMFSKGCKTMRNDAKRIRGAVSSLAHLLCCTMKNAQQHDPARHCVVSSRFSRSGRLSVSRRETAALCLRKAGDLICLASSFHQLLLTSTVCDLW